MRNWNTIRLIGCSLALACSLVCGRPAVAASASEPPAGEEDALEVVGELLAGEFGEVAGTFDENMAAALDETSLKAAWDSVTFLMGEHQGNVSVESAEVSGYLVYVVTESFANGNLQIQISYGPDGRIGGLYMRPVAGEAAGQEEAQTEEAQTEEAQTEDAQAAESYEEIELTVQADPAYPIGGTLTLPKNAEKPPVVILVAGSGANDRDERIAENRPFADIAHGLAERGIASLRCDKRYYVYPWAADPETENLREEYLDDVGAMVAQMETDERVDGSRVFVLGHSLGGSLVPVIAVEHPELSGVISMAGTLRPLWELSYDQYQEVYASAGVEGYPEEQKKAAEEQYEKFQEDIAALRSGEYAQDAYLLDVPAGYWRSIEEYCGGNFIGDVEMPMLILQGDADFQVYADKDYVLWQETLDGRENVTFRLYEGLNHLMMPTQGKRDTSEYGVAGHVDVRVIDDIASFVDGIAAQER